MKQLHAYAAGSLRKALPAMAQECRLHLDCVFGPSGLLRKRIERGERPELFFSASMHHCQALADQQLSTAPVLFAQNTVCLFGREEALHSKSPLQAMLHSKLRLGTSTPGADPGGDYAFAVFDRAEQLLPGCRDILRKKALTLVGGHDTPKGAGHHSPVVSLFETDAVDLFLGYHTTALDVASRMPGTSIVELPAELAVKACYCAVIVSSSAASQSALEALLSKKATVVLEECGFEAPQERV